MNTKHTPYTQGPWTWGARYICKPMTKRVIYTNDHDDEVKSETHSYELLAQCMPEDYASEKWKEIARLMSAAPDLLEALIALRKAELEDDSSDVSIGLLRDMADAAIAKATGASHVHDQ